MSQYNCLHCSGLFTSRKTTRKFCSKPCYTADVIARRVTPACKRCGCEIKGKDRLKRSYCSTACYQRNPDQYGKTTVVCGHCKIEFQAFRADRRQYCGHKCAAKGRSAEAARQRNQVVGVKTGKTIDGTVIKRIAAEVWASTEPIIPQGVKVTKIAAPSYDVRYQLPPGTRVVGGFATMGVGAYL